MNKEQVFEDFLKIIKNSWTWAKLTKEEQLRFADLISQAHIQDSVKGTRKNRWAILNAIYESFLLGLEYKPTGWRE